MSKEQSPSIRQDLDATRNCFLLPIPELDQAADLLDEAAGALLALHHDLARNLIDAANMPVLYSFAHSVEGPNNPTIHRLRVVPNAPPRLRRKRRALPPAIENGIFKYDGWRCRFCGCRVIAKGVRQRINSLLPNAITWCDSDSRKHAAFLALGASVDHVLPHARGGNDDRGNLVTACFACQYGRSYHTLEEVCLNDPRLRVPRTDGWDGLTRLLGQ